MSKKKPQVEKSTEIEQETLSFTPAQQSLIDYFIPYTFPPTLTLEFPTEDTWKLTYRGKEDTGSMSIDPNILRKIAENLTK